MRRSILALSVFLIAASVSQLWGQKIDEKISVHHGDIIRVGVAYPDPAITSETSRSSRTIFEDRDVLVHKMKELQSESSDPRKIEIVELDTTSPESALRDAKEKDCDFVIVTKFWDLKRNDPGDFPVLTKKVPGVDITPTIVPARSSMEGPIGIQLRLFVVSTRKQVVDEMLKEAADLGGRDAPEIYDRTRGLLELAATDATKAVRRRYKP